MSKYTLEAATSIPEQDAHAAADVPPGKIEQGNNTTGPGEKPLDGEIVATDRRKSSVVEKRETFIETFINRKSIIELLNGPNQLARKSVTLYGETFDVDDDLRLRIKYGQRVAVPFAFLGVTLNIFKSYSEVISAATMLCAIPVVVAVCLLYYKNISFVIVRKLLKQSNVIIIVTLSFCNLLVCIYKPDAKRSVVFDIFIFLFVNLFVFLDAVKLKSRIFALVIGGLFLVMVVTNLWRVTMGVDLKIVLLKYEFDNSEYTILKRPTQRSIFIQTLLFSISGLYTLFIDRKLELMMFCTGSIYRDTGTSSPIVQDPMYSKEMQDENIAMRKATCRKRNVVEKM